MERGERKKDYEKMRREIETERVVYKQKGKWKY